MMKSDRGFTTEIDTTLLPNKFLLGQIDQDDIGVINEEEEDLESDLYYNENQENSNFFIFILNAKKINIF